MPDYKSPAAKRRYERSTTVQPREPAYGGWEGNGTKLCPCRGYVLAVFDSGVLARVELHHLRAGTCVPRVEPLHVRTWLGAITGPVAIPQQVRETYGTAETTRTRAPSRQRRDRTADGRDRR